MLKKRKLANGLTRVTFSTPALDGAETVHLVGEFNNWDPIATPMEKRADGSWKVDRKLENRLSYEYRYLVNGLEWHNDSVADAYVANPYGTENSVVVLTTD
jgi:1,4-alpha-glucan branching enzyme